MYRKESSSKNILGSSRGPLHTSLVIWRGKIISKYSFYSLLSAFKNKHVFAITFHDSLRPVLKNGKKTAQKVFILYFKITRPLNRYCMFGNFTMILFTCLQLLWSSLYAAAVRGFIKALFFSCISSFCCWKP